MNYTEILKTRVKHTRLKRIVGKIKRQLESVQNGRV